MRFFSIPDKLQASLIVNFCQCGGLWIVVSLVLQLVLGMIRGVGLLMILPILYVSGVLEDRGAEGGILGDVVRWLDGLGIGFNLESGLLVFIASICVFGLLKRCNQLIEARIWLGYVRDLQKEVYHALTFAKWSYLARAKSSDLLHTLTSDLGMMHSGARQILAATNFLLIGLVNVLVALFISWQTTLIVMLVGVLLWAILSPINRRALVRSREQRGFQRSLFSEVMESFAAIKLIKSSGGEERSYNTFARVVEGMHQKMLAFQNLQANARFIYEVSAAVALSLLVWIALTLVHLNPATLIVLIYLFIRLVPLIASLQHSWQIALSAQPAYEAYCQLMTELEEEKESFSGETSPIQLNETIRFDSVDYRYANQNNNVINDLSFSIPANTLTMISGRSGIGKTTLLDLLVGLLEPTRGAVYVDGVPLKGSALHAWRRHIAYVPQDTFLFHDTIRANLLWAKPDAKDEELLALLDTFTAGFVRDLPEGLDTIVGDGGQRLSGGQRQRIAIVRAILAKPQLLLLDEGTIALDAGCEAEVLSELQRLSEGMTVILVTHQERLWKEASHLIQL